MKTTTNNVAHTKGMVVGMYKGMLLYVGPMGCEPMGVETMNWKEFVEDCPVMAALLTKLTDGAPHYV